MDDNNFRLFLILFKIFSSDARYVKGFENYLYFLRAMDMAMVQNQEVPGQHQIYIQFCFYQILRNIMDSI